MFTSPLEIAQQFRTDLLCKHAAFVGNSKKEEVNRIQCEPLLNTVEKSLSVGTRKPAARTIEREPHKSNTHGDLMRSNKWRIGGDIQAEPTPVLFSLGQCVIHKRFNYRGVIIGFDRAYAEINAWARSMNSGNLKYGQRQPFYHVLPDTRDRPGAQVVYVAQENLVLDMPAKAPQHPLINKLFTGFDTTLGVFLLSTTLQTIFSPSTVNED